VTVEAILRGLRAVELSAFVAAPLAGATLASLGAEVVRIDPPGGGIDAGRWPLHEGRSLYWAGLNQGKRSVTIDTRTDEGQHLATRLIAEAGMVLTNLPAVGWSSYERLTSQRPDLIMAVLTGNPDGSAAVDYTVNAAIGFPFVTGPEGWEGPVNHVLPAWDALAGHLMATGLIAAELHRTRTGQGQLLRLSLADVALSVASSLGLVAEAQLTAAPRGRFGNDLYGTYSHDFHTSDGRHVIVVALTPRQWTAVVDATGLAAEVNLLEAERGLDLRREGDRFAARREITALLEGWIGQRSYAEVAEAFDSRQVLWGPYRTFKELVRDDPRCSVRNPLFEEVEQPGIGRYLRAASPLVFGAAERVPPKPSPEMGADTAAVLRSWLGVSDQEIEALASAGVVAPPARPAPQGGRK
jgi:2-methylfumaryl-CoA isomerase